MGNSFGLFVIRAILSNAAGINSRSVQAGKAPASSDKKTAKPSTLREIKSVFGSPEEEKKMRESISKILSGKSLFDPIIIKLERLERAMNGNAPANNKTIETSLGTDKIYNEKNKNTDEAALRSTESKGNTGVIDLPNMPGPSTSGLLAAPGGTAEIVNDVASGVSDALDQVLPDQKENDTATETETQKAGEGKVRFDAPWYYKP